MPPNLTTSPCVGAPETVPENNHKPFPSATAVKSLIEGLPPCSVKRAVLDSRSALAAYSAPSCGTARVMRKLPCALVVVEALTTPVRLIVSLGTGTDLLVNCPENVACLPGR